MCWRLDTYYYRRSMSECSSSRTLIRDELLQILPRSCSNALLVFVSFTILFRDFRFWIFLLQLWILQYLFLSSTVRFFSCSFKAWFPLCHFLSCFFSSHPSYVVVPSRSLRLYSFHDVLSWSDTTRNYASTLGDWYINSSSSWLRCLVSICGGCTKQWSRDNMQRTQNKFLHTISCAS